MNGVSTFIASQVTAALVATLIPVFAQAQSSSGPCADLAALAQSTNKTDASVAVPDPTGTISPARQRASLLFRALTGVQIPIDDLRLKCMEAKILQGNDKAAVQVATSDALFYDVRVRDIARKMSTRAESITAPLSDFVATFVGVVRDSCNSSTETCTGAKLVNGQPVNAKMLLTGNFIYVADSTIATGVPMDQNSLYNSNAHYDFIQAQGFSLKKVLKRQDGQMVYLANSGDTDNPDAAVTPAAAPSAHPDPAGLLTTRGFFMAHAIAGTNRRMVEFTFREFMCQPIANWADTSVPEDYIGRDVDRAPSGDHQRFENTCKGCHGQMDGLRPAFVHADFVPDMNDPSLGKAVYQQGISPKYARNQTTNNLYNKTSQPFATLPGQDKPIGYRVQTNNWVNYTTGPHNMDLFGWRTTNIGSGMQQLGQMLANSQGFSRCMAKRVFSSVCKREPSTTDEALMRHLAEDFESDNYHLRHLFESVALRPECIGL